MKGGEGGRREGGMGEGVERERKRRIKVELDKASQKRN